MSFERVETPLSLSRLHVGSEFCPNSIQSSSLDRFSHDKSNQSLLFDLFIAPCFAHSHCAETMVSWVDITRTITLLTVVGEAALLEGVVELGAEREVG